MYKIIFIALLLLWSSLSFASATRVYLSPMEESKWTMTEDSLLKCQMEHRITRFGRAVFYQESGRPLKLKIESYHRYKKDLEIAFRSVTANWKGIKTEADLAMLKSSGRHTLVDVADATARHAFFELQQGYQPSLFFKDLDDNSSPVSVILSTVFFRDVQADFDRCVQRLYPDHFDDVKLARVYFDFDEEFPTQNEEQQALKKLLDYLQVDDSIKSITVSGHTDYKGSECYNETLSARRAWYVYDYLLQSGVDPALLRIEFKGERDPLVKGRDDRSRAKNRRVEVLLHR